MAEQEIVTEVKGRVAIVRLNWPERRNALSWESGRRLRNIIDEFNQDKKIGAVVWTGTDPIFCGGWDVGSWKRGLENEDAEDVRRPADDESWLAFCVRSKPIVCAINGPSIGAGMTMTLNCDARIASDRARFSMRFIRVGIVPELASTMLLAHIVGFHHAMELMLTGKTIDAQEADRIGLVNRVVPHESLMDEAVALAQEMADNDTELLLAVKKLAWTNLTEPDIRKIMTRESEELLAGTQRPAFREAVMAFMEKRKPDFHRES
ncbi:MAG: enoyl-CoA hydratase-related protein [Dehalococcoidia bacterium]|nr:enoyl-CoA hydratase-related protein [Dehalococcoidia bacterium]